MTDKNYFSNEELSCPCCGENKFNPQSLLRFNRLREYLGFPLQMTSGYRCEKYNRKIGATQSHATGHCGDLSVNRQRAYAVLAAAPKFGFTGIGIHQKGARRFIHLDDLKATYSRVRPTVWSY